MLSEREGGKREAKEMRSVSKRKKRMKKRKKKK